MKYNFTEDGIVSSEKERRKWSWNRRGEFHLITKHPARLIERFHLDLEAEE